MISEYLEEPVVYYYNYNTILHSYSLLVDTMMEYDRDNKPSIDTKYMNDITSIKSYFDVYYYHL